MYDVNIKRSFELLDDWMKEAQRFGVGSPVVLVCGNKVRLSTKV